MDSIDISLSYMKVPPPKSFIKRLSVHLKSINEYPSGDYSMLKDRIAKYARVKKENIIVGNGSDEIIDIITRAFGQRVLIPVPTFSQFEEAAKRKGSVIKRADSLNGTKYEIKFDKKDLWNSTLVWICNPNNPTGSTVPLEKIESVASGTKAITAIDECLFEYSGDTAVPLLKNYMNMIVTRSMSKAFGIAGIRLGYAIADSTVIARLEEYRQPFNVNIIAEAAGIAAFDYINYYKRAIERVKMTRQIFTEELSKLGLRYIESSAPFVFVSFGSMAKAKNYYSFMSRHGVKVFPAWDKEFSGSKLPFIRFSIGTEEEMSKVVEVLAQAQKSVGLPVYMG